MSQSEPIRVLIVDDHRMVRDGLKLFLSQYEDLVVVGEAAGGREALALCARDLPDVILMDMIMPDLSGPEATGLIRAAFPTVQVVALTSFDDEDLVTEAIGAGAIGYLFKDVNAERLAQVIRDAHHGRSSLAPGAAQALVQAAQQDTALGHDLTPREREVLACLTEGKTNKEIGAALVISTATARLHVSNILAKLGAANRTEAASLAVQHGLIS